MHDFFEDPVRSFGGWSQWDRNGQAGGRSNFCEVKYDGIRLRRFFRFTSERGVQMISEGFVEIMLKLDRPYLVSRL